MKKSFYDVLGVDKEATQEDIKRAFRKKASKAHPDKGGLTDDMVELNKVYKCLSNAQSRLFYDQNGEEPKPDDTAKLAKDLVMDIFMKVLKEKVENDVIGVTRKNIQKQLVELNGALAKMKEVEDMLNRRKGKVRVKKKKAKQGTINLWDMLISERLKELSLNRVNVDREITVRSIALKVLDDYEEDAAIVQYQMSTTGTWALNFNIG